LNYSEVIVRMRATLFRSTPYHYLCWRKSDRKF